MPKVEKEIEELAKSMEKSTKTPSDNLVDTIQKLGPEGIRKKLPTLNKSEKTVLLNILKGMKDSVKIVDQLTKAASPSMDDNYHVGYHRGKVYQDTIIQEDKADDDADEKLVKPANAKMKHQGDNAPEGIEGQVIKAKSENKAKEKLADAVDDVAEDEVKEHEKKMHKMKKSINGKEVDLLELKSQAEEVLKSEGVEEITDELLKGKMKAMLMEEKQSEDKLDDLQNDKTRAKKEKLKDQIEEKDANKMAQDKVDDMNQGAMKKSIDWQDPNALLKANTGGRNHHFSINSYYDRALNMSTDTPENITKSQSKEAPKQDLNDIIEKGMDSDWNELRCTQIMAKSIVDRNGKLVKSFEDNEIAQALGLTEEEAKKILG